MSRDRFSPVWRIVPQAACRAPWNQPDPGGFQTDTELSKVTTWWWTRLTLKRSRSHAGVSQRRFTANTQNTRCIIMFDPGWIHRNRVWRVNTVLFTVLKHPDANMAPVHILCFQSLYKYKSIIERDIIEFLCIFWSPVNIFRHVSYNNWYNIIVVFGEMIQSWSHSFLTLCLPCGTLWNKMSDFCGFEHCLNTAFTLTQFNASRSLCYASPSAWTSRRRYGAATLMRLCDRRRGGTTCATHNEEI